MLKDNGVEVAVITARDSKAVAYRMKNLGITHFYQGQADKVVAFNVHSRANCAVCVWTINEFC
jgi:3-deoxy-D-manno-octulosonate 8-phosphate phosphatase (KDO 8-P phosphatase)